MDQVVPTETVEKRILLLRGQRVMLSYDLAELYEVEPRALIQAVRRNIERFPEDFMFQLTWAEVDFSRSQNVILKRGRNVKYLPYAFTEQGVAMLSSVLRSRRAALVNVAIMRAFVKLREILASHKDLARKLEELENMYDEKFRVVFDAIRQLMTVPNTSRRRIGFNQQDTDGVS